MGKDYFLVANSVFLSLLSDVQVPSSKAKARQMLPRRLQPSWEPREMLLAGLGQSQQPQTSCGSTAHPASEPQPVEHRVCSDVMLYAKHRKGAE